MTTETLLILASPVAMAGSQRFLMKKACRYLPRKRAWLPVYFVYYIVWCLLFPMVVTGNTDWRFFTEIGFTEPTGSDFWWLLLAVLLPLPNLFHMLSKINARPNSTDILVIVFFVLANPFFEELYWRGFIFGHLGQTVWVALYSSLAVGVFHYATLSWNWDVFKNHWGTIGASVMGLIWSALFAITGSLWVPFASHVVINLGAVFFLLDLASVNQADRPSFADTAAKEPELSDRLN